MNTRSAVAAQCIVRYRRPLLVLAALVTLALATQLLSLSISNSLALWYPENDPVLQQYREFQKQFGNHEVVVVVINDEQGFTGDGAREQLEDLTSAMFDIEGVSNVTSLVTVPRSMTLARERLLSDDGKTTALLVQIHGENIEVVRPGVLADIRQVAGTFDPGNRLAGYGVIFDSLNDASTRGSAALLATAHAVMFVVLLLAFRRFGPLVLTMAVVSAATIWTMGLYASLGEQINMITMVLPTLVLVIGTADSVHLLRAVARQPRRLAPIDRARRGLTEVLRPCLFASLTTAGGFLALTVSDLPVVRTLGLFGASGVMIAFVVTFALAPAFLLRRRMLPDVDHALMDRVAQSLADVGRKAPRTVVAGFLFVTAFAVAGVARLTVDTCSICYLDATHPTRVASDAIEHRIGAYAPIEFVLRGPDVLRADVLDQLQAWQLAADELPAIEWSWSLLDAAGVDRDRAPSSLQPDAFDARLSRLQRLAPGFLESMLVGRSVMRVTFGVRMGSAQSIRASIGQLLQTARFPEQFVVQSAGYATLYTRIVDRIVTSQLGGFALALALILVLLAIAYRSCAGVALAVPANLFPVAVTLGLMGWAGVPLDVATVTIATIILGLIVDDTVHLLNRRRGPSDTAGELDAAVHKVGGTLVTTSLVFCAGFAVMGFAEVQSIAWFGLLSAFAIAAAIVTDLMLLPALTRITQQRPPTECSVSSAKTHRLINHRSGDGGPEGARSALWSLNR